MMENINKAITQSKYKGLFLSLQEESKTLVQLNKFYNGGFYFMAMPKDKPSFFF